MVSVCVTIIMLYKISKYKREKKAGLVLRHDVLLDFNLRLRAKIHGDVKINWHATTVCNMRYENSSDNRVFLHFSVSET